MPDWRFTEDSPGCIAAAHLVKAVRADEPVEAVNFVIEGDVDLSGVAYSHRLVIRNGVFTGVLDLSEAHFKRTIDVTNCVFQKAIRCVDTEISGNLMLMYVTLSPPAGTNAKADFSRVRIAGDVDGTGLQCTCDIDFQHTQISGNLHFESTSGQQAFFGGYLNLRAAKILGNVNMRGIQARDEVRIAGAEIAGELCLWSQNKHRARIGGNLSLENAKVGKVTIGGMELMGDLKGQNLIVGDTFMCLSPECVLTKFGASVELDGASTGNSVTFGGVLIAGDLSLSSAKIQGSIYFDPINKQQTEINGKLLLSDASVSAEVKLSGAKIGGDFIAIGTKFGTLSANPVDEHCTEFGSGLAMLNIQAQLISLQGAKISGDLFIRSSSIGILRCSSIDERKRTLITGSVSLDSVDILGGASFDGVQIQESFGAYNARISGSLNFRKTGETTCTEVHGDVSLSRARFIQSAAFEGTKIHKSLFLAFAEINDVSLEARETEVEGSIEMVGLHAKSVKIYSPCFRKNKINLAFAKILELAFLGEPPQKTELPGLEVQSLNLPCDDYRGLLASTDPFRTESYLSFEKWLRDRGKEEEANEIYLDMRRRRRREMLRGARRLGDWFLDWSTRYGIGSYRLIVYLLVVFCLSVLVFCLPKALEHDPVNMECARWPQAAWVALQTTFPMFAIPGAKNWQPTRDSVILMGRHLWVTYDGYASVVSFLSWIVVPLFVASIAGLLKQK